jgi:hypothetical protein
LRRHHFSEGLKVWLKNPERDSHVVAPGAAVAVSLLAQEHVDPQGEQISPPSYLVRRPPAVDRPR